jgi:hypothetical protein
MCGVLQWLPTQHYPPAPHIYFLLASHGGGRKSLILTLPASLAARVCVCDPILTNRA